MRGADAGPGTARRCSAARARREGCQSRKQGRRARALPAGPPSRWLPRQVQAASQGALTGQLLQGGHHRRRALAQLRLRLLQACAQVVRVQLLHGRQAGGGQPLQVRHRLTRHADVAGQRQHAQRVQRHQAHAAGVHRQRHQLAAGGRGRRSTSGGRQAALGAYSSTGGAAAGMPSQASHFRMQSSACGARAGCTARLDSPQTSARTRRPAPRRRGR